jgi:hypothetical protein
MAVSTRKEGATELHDSDADLSFVLLFSKTTIEEYSGLEEHRLFDLKERHEVCDLVLYIQRQHWEGFQ